MIKSAFLVVILFAISVHCNTRYNYGPPPGYDYYGPQYYHNHYHHGHQGYHQPSYNRYPRNPQNGKLCNLIYSDDENFRKNNKNSTKTK